MDQDERGSPLEPQGISSRLEQQAEVEREVLSNVIYDLQGGNNGAVERLLAYSEGHFTVGIHKALFNALRDLIENKSELNVKEWYKKASRDPLYERYKDKPHVPISEISQNTIAPASGDYYFDLLGELHYIREAQSIALDVVTASDQGILSEKLGVFLQRLDDLEKITPGRSMKPHTVVGFLALDIEDKGDIIEGVLSRESIGILAGSPKVGKTFAVTQLALSVATGREVWGFSTQPCRVLMVNQEVSEGQLQDRMAGQIKAQGIDIDDTGNNLLVVSENDLKLTDRRDLRLLKSTVRECGIDLLILDPLNRFFAGDENTASDVGTFLDCVSELRNCGTAVLLVHHTRKPAPGRRRGASTLDDIRGSSVFFSHGDTYMILSAPRDSQPELRRLDFSLRNHPTPEPLWLEWSGERLSFEVTDTPAHPTRKGGWDLVAPALSDLGGTAAAKDLRESLMESTGATYSTVHSWVSQAVEEGTIEVVNPDDYYKIYRLAGRDERLIDYE